MYSMKAVSSLLHLRQHTRERERWNYKNFVKLESNLFHSTEFFYIITKKQKTGNHAKKMLHLSETQVRKIKIKKFVIPYIRLFY